MDVDVLRHLLSLLIIGRTSGHLQANLRGGMSQISWRLLRHVRDTRTLEIFTINLAEAEYYFIGTYVHGPLCQI